MHISLCFACIFMACFVACNGRIHTCHTFIESLDCLVLQKIIFRATRIFYGSRETHQSHLGAQLVDIWKCEIYNPPINEINEDFSTCRIFSWLWKLFFANLSNLSFQWTHHRYVYDHYNVQNKPCEWKQNRGKCGFQKPHYKISNSYSHASTILSTTIFKMSSLPQIKKKSIFF